MPDLSSWLRGENPSLLGSILRIPLIPLAVLYGAVSELVIRTRSARVREHPPCPVIAVGNLEVGGIGKTPFVRWLAHHLQAQGEVPVVVSRGYGSPADGGRSDELAAMENSGFFVAADPNRTRGIRNALARHPEITVAILDDAFQARRDHRDLDLCLLDATRPFGAGWPLPAGSLRQFPRGAKKADLLILTRPLDVDIRNSETIPMRLGCLRSQDHGLARHQVTRLLPEGEAIGQIQGRPVFAACGIARPESFVQTLVGQGAEVCGNLFFPDHHGFTKDDMEEIHRRAGCADADMVVVTDKDWPKIAGLWNFSLPVRALEVQVIPDAKTLGLLKPLLADALASGREGGGR